MKKRLHAIFEGTVTGVGFRFTTLEIAKRYQNITGWVRNTPQGDVELVAEGNDEDLKKLLNEIQNSFKEYITGTSIWREEPTGEFNSFKIWNGPVRD